MPRRLVLLVAALLLAGQTGCPSMWPRLFNPGDIQTQRYSATLHDPYPNVYEGPPVVGGRPRDYLNPLPEPKANQLQQELRWRRWP